jgi:cyanate permease
MAGRELSGIAAGFGLTMTSLGIIVGPPIFGLIVDSTGSYRLAWLFTAACIAVGTAIIALINEEKKKM